ncbi:MAG: hypothetical protein ABL984_00540 [Pyrinomonadaceae bacterium]
MSRIVAIVLSQMDLDNLSNALTNAGAAVGRREARRANVFLLKDGEGHTALTTFDGEAVGWGLLVGSVRYSTSQGKYVVSTNDFLDEDVKLKAHDLLDAGLASGLATYEESTATVRELEALDKKAVLRLNIPDVGLTSSTPFAYFEKRDDAEAWSKAKAGDREWARRLVFVDPRRRPR